MWGVWHRSTVKKSQWGISVGRAAETGGKCAPHICLACTGAEIQGNFKRGLITSPPPMPEIPEHRGCRDQRVQLPLLHTAPYGSCHSQRELRPSPIRSGSAGQQFNHFGSYPVLFTFHFCGCLVMLLLTQSSVEFADSCWCFSTQFTLQIHLPNCCTYSYLFSSFSILSSPLFNS